MLLSGTSTGAETFETARPPLEQQHSPNRKQQLLSTGNSTHAAPQLAWATTTLQSLTCCRVQEARLGRGSEVMVPSGCMPGVPSTGLGPDHHQSGRSPAGPLTSSASPLGMQGG